ncbi:universal stress protein [Treponema zioleckii]|uniref:universal stress protein n=1 Tax=Treponema zioleckii TaxID=331680 RepID=UPI00168BDAB9|nr:universal stress protein [Treponema zioleckii]
MIKPLLERILVAVNGSEQSMRAAMYAIMLAKQYNCMLKAIYVVDTATLKQLTMSKFFVAEESERYEKSLNSEGNRYLSHVCQLAEKKGVLMETELKKGAVWSQIISAADEYEANVIVLGGKKSDSGSFRSSFRHDKLSATNSEIVANSNCNVLIVHQDKIEKMFELL